MYLEKYDLCHLQLFFKLVYKCNIFRREKSKGQTQSRFKRVIDVLENEKVH